METIKRRYDFRKHGKEYNEGSFNRPIEAMPKSRVEKALTNLQKKYPSVSLAGSNEILI